MSFWNYVKKLEKPYKEKYNEEFEYFNVYDNNHQSKTFTLDLLSNNDMEDFGVPNVKKLQREYNTKTQQTEHKQNDNLYYSNGREYVDENHVSSNTIELKQSFKPKETINSKYAQGDNIEKIFNAYIDRINLTLESAPKIVNVYDFKQEYVDELDDTSLLENKNLAFEANMAEHLTNLDYTNRPKQKIHSNLIKHKNKRDKHFINTHKVINKLVTKCRSTKTIELLELTSEPLDIHESNIYEQESYMITKDLRRKENNYDQKWEPINMTHEEDPYVLMEAFHERFGAALREGNSSM